MGSYLDLQATKIAIDKGFNPIIDNEIIGDYYYQNDELVYWEFLEKTKEDGSNHPIPQIHIYDILKWLREEKKIHIIVDFDVNMTWYYQIAILLPGQIAIYGNSDTTNTNYGYDSYEEATFNGIKYVLDNLI